MDTCQLGTGPTILPKMESCMCASGGVIVFHEQECLLRAKSNGNLPRLKHADDPPKYFEVIKTASK